MQYFKNNRAKLSCSLNEFYRSIETSKQAVHQEHARQVVFDQRLDDLIILMDVLRTDHPGCGLAKAYDTLRPDFIGRDRFIRCFQELGYRIRVPRKSIKTTKPGDYTCPNLIEGMIIGRTNRVVQSDITYISVGDNFYYAIFIIDVFSKRIVGHQASDHMRVEANLRAFRELVRLRGKKKVAGLIHHSDRGGQYGSKEYRQLLARHECLISMDTSAEKNAYAERVNGIIKNEYLAFWNIEDLDTLQKKLKQAVNHYNHERIHRYLPKKLSPVCFEKQWENSPQLKKHRELIYHPKNYVKRSIRKTFFETCETAKGYYCPILIT